MNTLFSEIDLVDIGEVNTILGTSYTEKNLLKRSRRGTFPSAIKMGKDPAYWSSVQVIRWGRSKSGSILENN